jgi:hypothetical protein
MKSLFGEQIADIPTPKARGLYQQWKRDHHYRKAVDEKRCGKCAHLRNCGEHTTFFKCVLMGCSHSTATDIRKRNTCDLWEQSFHLT